MNIPPALRDDLIRYLLATSEERASIIAELAWRNARLADLLVGLEAHDDLRALFEMELLDGGDGAPRPETHKWSSASSTTRHRVRP